MQNTINLVELNLSDAEIAKFWDSVKKGSDTQCWLWTAGRNDQGYGRFSIWRGARNYRLGAHRVAFFLQWRIDPRDYLVCHECDNPLCCNPNCLFSGTYQDNSDDKVRKRRHKWGRSVGAAIPKLTADDVMEIRRLYATTKTSHRKLAAQFGIAHSQVKVIVRRFQWKNI